MHQHTAEESRRSQFQSMTWERECPDGNRTASLGCDGTVGVWETDHSSHVWNVEDYFHVMVGE